MAMSDGSFRTEIAGESAGQRFISVAARQGDRPAVQWPEGTWSYGRLAEAALRRSEEFTGGGGPVALDLPRGPELVAAMLGASLAGRVWTVLNSKTDGTAVERVRRALGPHTIAGENGLAHERGRGGVVHDAEASSICFTSGSTGAPKGVVHGRAATLANALAGSASLGITPEDRCLWLSAPSAAATQSAVFYPLLNGACVLPFEVGVEGLSELAAWIAQSRATVYHSIPTVFRALLRSVREREQLASLRVVKLGGEPVFGADVRFVRERCGEGLRLVNALGMSEANGNVCHEVLGEPDPAWPTMPVGRALPGFTISLRDAEGRDAGDSEDGFLRITGPGLALGYWAGEGGEVERLATVPGEADARIFASMDQGRLLADGRLIHLGRGDGVVKVRGVRVAIAGVEAGLRAVPGVAEAVVVANGGLQGEVTLAAWAQLETGRTLSEGALRAALVATLEPEAVPRSIEVRLELPRLPGGKIDRQKLIETPSAKTAMNARAKDESDGAESLAVLFARALGRSGFGVNQNFFTEGGDSLGATVLAVEIERAHGVVLHPATLAECPTPGQLWWRLKVNIPAPALLLSSGDKDSRDPLWLFGGAGNLAYELVPLARRLKGWGPVYGFEAAPTHDGRWLWRVEDIVAEMLPALLAVQPEGPYRLAGTSFGGILAFEIAHQLRSEGREVAFLGMLDAYGPNYPQLAAELSLRDYKRLAVVKVLRNRPHLLKFRPTHLGKSLLTVLSRFVDRWRIRRGTMPKISDPIRRVMVAEEACLMAKKRYRFRPINVDICTFAASFFDAHLFIRADHLGWARQTSARLRKVEVPGLHNQHIRPPHVDYLAAHMLAQLSKNGSGKISLHQSFLGLFDRCEVPSLSGSSNEARMEEATSPD
jgi:acyl-coenzyme A synthetase/AMP-(fatty) acid ligase/thioesterase domain-containing protein